MQEIELKTPYEWCLELNIRVLDLNEWPLEWFGSKEKHYFMFPTMVKNEFLEALSQCKVKANSMPRKTEMYLEYRMYGLVNYQLSGTIHAGIQFGHAVVEYQQNVRNLPPHEAIYNKWAKNDKTFIILNGGTTNNNVGSLGTLNKHLQTLKDNEILTAEFNEPDLGDQLTAIVFLVDERVWNRDLYEDFVGTPYTWSSHKKPSDKEYEKWEEVNNKNYAAWVERVGGEKNVFLRDYLRTLKLA
jgi:hypothetical protein